MSERESNRLAKLVEDGTIDLLDYQTSPYFDQNILDEMIDLISSVYTKSLTFRELVERFEKSGSEDYYEYLGETEEKVLNALYVHWVNVFGLLSRSDNYLSENLSENDWRTGYHKALTNYVIENGRIVAFGDKLYGWSDYKADQVNNGQVIAAFNLKEESWSEFAGTFVDNNEKRGVQVDVLYVNGISRTLRVETSFSEVLSEITK